MTSDLQLASTRHHCCLLPQTQHSHSHPEAETEGVPWRQGALTLLIPPYTSSMALLGPGAQLLHGQSLTAALMPF